MRCASHGWWARASPLKNMNVNWDDEIPNIWENKKWSKPPTRKKYCRHNFYICHHGPSCAGMLTIPRAHWPNFQVCVVFADVSPVHRCCVKQRGAPFAKTGPSQGAHGQLQQMESEAVHMLKACHLAPGECAWWRWIENNIGQMRSSFSHGCSWVWPVLSPPTPTNCTWMYEVTQAGRPQNRHGQTICRSGG